MKSSEVIGDMSWGPVRPNPPPAGVANHQVSIPRLELNAYSAALTNPTSRAATAATLAAKFLLAANRSSPIRCSQSEAPISTKQMAVFTFTVDGPAAQFFRNPT